MLVVHANSCLCRRLPQQSAQETASSNGSNTQIISPAARKADPVVVIGAGPAGLFAALAAAEAGLPVVLLERGTIQLSHRKPHGPYHAFQALADWNPQPVLARRRALPDGCRAAGGGPRSRHRRADGPSAAGPREQPVLRRRRRGHLERRQARHAHRPQHGSRPACPPGTPRHLRTLPAIPSPLAAKRVNRLTGIAQVLHDLGAPESILVAGKPHLGTDRLVKILRAFRHRLQSLGVEIRFGTRAERLLTQGNRCSGVQLSGAALPPCQQRLARSSAPFGRGLNWDLYLPCADGERIKASRVVVAPGHSSRALLSQLQDAGVKLVPKPFALGECRSALLPGPALSCNACIMHPDASAATSRLRHHGAPLCRVPCRAPADLH